MAVIRPDTDTYQYPPDIVTSMLQVRPLSFIRLPVGHAEQYGDEAFWYTGGFIAGGKSPSQMKDMLTPDGKQVTPAYSYKKYVTYDSLFTISYSRARKGWQIFYTQQLDEEYPEVQEDFHQSGMGHAWFSRRRDAVEALEALVAPYASVKGNE